MIEFYPEGRLIDSSENRNYLQSPSGLVEAYSSEKILEARAIICDSSHNLIMDLGCMKGIIPREEGAIGIKEGTVRDIAVISKVNRAVSFVITDFAKNDMGEDIAILSRRKAQEMCMEKYINNLSSGDIIPARVTHMENFGVFADIGCGVVSFLPIDTLSISRIAHPKERFRIGMDIKVVVKYLDGDRVHLTHKELLGTWEENADMFAIGETVGGIVRSVEEYGVFVELTPNLAGLAEPYPDVTEGQQVSVYIKNIVPDKMKIKLVIIDTFDSLPAQTKLKYFYKGTHMDSFLYSPEKSTKVIETHFEPCVCRN
ncbi:MAG: 30S ribosomal protein S1 [Clostridia bacterium]|nr:30S ribosomal protein S1 [Clostridia bacterium]